MNNSKKEFLLKNEDSKNELIKIRDLLLKLKSNEIKTTKETFLIIEKAQETVEHFKQKWLLKCAKVYELIDCLNLERIN